MLKRVCNVLLTVGMGISLAFASSGGDESVGTKRKTRAKAPTKASVEIKVVPVGLQEEDVERLKQQVLNSAAVQKELGGTNFSLISIEYLEAVSNRKAALSRASAAQERFRFTFYDYTNERAVVAEGAISAPEMTRVYEDTGMPPNVSEEEFAAAVRIIEQNSSFSDALKDEKAVLYRPMPPITVNEAGERLINVGIEPRDSSVKVEVVSVSLKRSNVVRYEDNAPPTSQANALACGMPSAFQQTTSIGTPGQYQATITQNGATLWEFLVIRPSASTGTNQSGIELRNVKYRGKSVFKRAHAPVLNVEYVTNVCGPYRDWQYQEGMFQTPTSGNTDPAPGIRILPEGAVATTGLETGNDQGNFRGVAMYRQNNETVMVSEMEAGWYRYIMEWRLADDGTIRPRYGFGGTNNSCVCNVHNHHVYWRFDFDIVQEKNNIYQVERGRKFLRPVESEVTFLRNYQTNRSLLIQNSGGDEAYMLVPNLSDGKADNYGRGDFWVLRYKNVAGGTNLQNEIDDGYNQTGGPGTAININGFANGETVKNEDSVIWYGAHFIHSDGVNLLEPDRSGLVLSGSHVVGPDIRPIRW